MAKKKEEEETSRWKVAGYIVALGLIATVFVVTSIFMIKMFTLFF